MAERIYLDTCVLNRPTDDQSQERIRIEAAATAQVFDAVSQGDVEWFASEALVAELMGVADTVRRQDTLRLLLRATTVLALTPMATARAQDLSGEGYGRFDAIHLALAEEAGLDTLLTVDDRFMARASRRPVGALPSVENPVDWCRRRQPWLIKR